VAVTSTYVGPDPAGIVATTVRAVVSITETVSEPRLVTKARVPVGSKATDTGFNPTGIVATTVLVVVLITATWSLE
jgi:hypothetical protein